MSEPARHLRPVIDGEIPEDAPSYGDALSMLTKLENTLIGMDTTIKSQAGIIGSLKTKLEEVDPTTHPQHKEMAALIDQWKEATGHPNAKRSKDRFDVIRARLKEGYTVEQLQLAIEGLGAFPYEQYGQRYATEGSGRVRRDQLSAAFKGGESVERLAVLGYRARQA